MNSRRVTRVVYEQGYTETARATAGLPSGAHILRDAGLAVHLASTSFLSRDERLREERQSQGNDPDSDPLTRSQLPRWGFPA